MRHDGRGGAYPWAPRPLLRCQLHGIRGDAEHVGRLSQRGLSGHEAVVERCVGAQRRGLRAQDGVGLREDELREGAEGGGASGMAAILTTWTFLNGSSESDKT